MYSPYFGLGVIAAYLLLLAVAAVATLKFSDTLRDMLAGLIRSELSRIAAEAAEKQRAAIEADITAAKGRG